VHGTLISMGLIEHRPGVGTFVLEQQPRRKLAGEPVKVAAREVVAAYDEWHAKAKPRALSEAIEDLRGALR
jgi:hypothetical protein